MTGGRAANRRTLIASAACIAALAALGCNGAGPNDPNAPSPAVSGVHKRIGGVWRLSGYVPEKDLDASLLLKIQSDKIMIRFEDGHVSSVSSSLDFKQAYRISDVYGDNFKLFIRDEKGTEYESHCQFDASGTLSFETITEPWRGRGVLQREGPASEADFGD